MERKSLLNSPHPYALTTSVFWSLAYALTRVCSQYLPSFQIAFLRCLVAACTMVVVIAVKKIPLPKMKDLKWFILCGFVGFFIYMIFFNMGCTRVTSATGNVVLATAPIVTALGARVIFHEKLKAVQWCGIAVAFIGVVILTVLAGGFTVNIGLLWLMLAMLIMSTYNLLQRYLGRVKQYDTLMINAYSIIFGAIFLSIFAPQAFRTLSTAPPKAYIVLLILGVGCSGIAYCSWTKAFSVAKTASTVSNYMSINPFIGSIFGYLLLNDPIESNAIYGGLTIMLGLCIFNFGPGFLEKRKKGTA